MSETLGARIPTPTGAATFKCSQHSQRALTTWCLPFGVATHGPNDLGGYNFVAASAPDHEDVHPVPSGTVLLALNPLDAHSLLSTFGTVGIFVAMFLETGLLVGFFLRAIRCSSPRACSVRRLLPARCTCHSPSSSPRPPQAHFSARKPGSFSAGS